MFGRLVLFILISVNHLDLSETFNPIPQITDDQIQQISNILQPGSNFIQQLSAVLLPIALKLPASECRDQFVIWGNALANGENWAIRMLDATAKPQAGILLGNIMHLGNYDECLEIDAEDNNTRVQGKYCTSLFGAHPTHGRDLDVWLSNYMGSLVPLEGNLSLPLRFKFSYSFCFPKVCTAANLQDFFDLVEDELKSPAHFTFFDEFCGVAEKKPFTNSTTIAILIFSLFAAVMVASTIYEYFHSQEASKPSLLTAFSVITNGKRLFSTSTSEGSLKCLNGLRVISMMWIVLIHGFQYSFYSPHVNSVQMLTVWKNATENAIMTGGSIAVDTFFIISGSLLVYLFMKSRDKGIKFNLPMFYLHRIIRLTPSLVMTVYFTLTLLEHLGNGPFWPVVTDMFYQPCKKNWWSTVIYLQNYINPLEMCVGQAWYLAVDTQMYFLSPLILFPLVKWPKRTIAAIMVFVVLNCVYVFVITWQKHLGTNFFDQNDDAYEELYYPTHVRGTVYLMGMICGYVVYKTKSTRPLKLCKVKVVALWIFSLAVMIGVVLGHSPMMKNQIYDVMAASLFNSLVRVGWGLALSIVIVLCVNDYGGFINSFLSHDVFTVLIKLNYNIYLLHLNLMLIITAQDRASTYFSNLFGMHKFWGDYVFSIGASILWTLAFESPILILEKIVFSGKKSESKKSDNELQNDNVTESTVSVDISENGTSSTAPKKDK